MPQIINVVGKYLKANKSWKKIDAETIKGVTVHSEKITLKASTDEEKLDIIFKKHKKKTTWAGISYHFVIFQNGNVYKINEYTHRTPHDNSKNNNIGICVEFDDGKDINANPELLSAYKLTLETILKDIPSIKKENIKGHNEISSKTKCPYSFSKYIKNFTNNVYMSEQTVLGDSNLSQEEIAKVKDLLAKNNSKKTINLQGLSLDDRTIKDVTRYTLIAFGILAVYKGLIDEELLFQIIEKGPEVLDNPSSLVTLGGALLYLLGFKQTNDKNKRKIEEENQKILNTIKQ